MFAIVFADGLEKSFDLRQQSKTGDVPDKQDHLDESCQLLLSHFDLDKINLPVFTHNTCIHYNSGVFSNQGENILKALLKILEDLHRAPFGKIKGKLRLGIDFSFDDFTLRFERIQGSPGADPASIIRIAVGKSVAGFHDALISSPARRLALSDFLIRRFREGIILFAQQNRGKDGSGSFRTIELSQSVLQRGAVEISGNEVALRFVFSFPSMQGRGGGQLSFPQARIMLEEELPRIARNALLLNNYDDSTQKALEKHIECVEIWAVIQQELKAQGLVAFIADGAILPRRSGDDDRPRAHG
ncbi:MAG: ABC-ATPase domain-containing protein, partial [Desulfobacterales bacterium]|nr:ABC-ATPase domain-containing protein [Desulfobacterales bacterium]